MYLDIRLRLQSFSFTLIDFCFQLHRRVPRQPGNQEKSRGKSGNLRKMLQIRGKSWNFIYWPKRESGQLFILKYYVHLHMYHLW